MVKGSPFENKFKAQTKRDTRLVDNRTERPTGEDLPKVCINFKDFDFTQCPPGQNFNSWQSENLLECLCTKFISLCELNIVEATQQGVIKIYGNFPKNSEFHLPRHIQEEVKWGTLQRIGGQKPRVAGYVIDNVFYPVFLDKDHKFCPSKK